jgi:hypothetical protein
MNMEYLRNMIMGMRYQNGLEIDTDHMTYEELLELEDKMGSVSKGLTEEQFGKIQTVTATGLDEVCSICYCNVKEGEEVVRLPCQHHFHVDCIKQWLLKERTCPLCKQEIQQPPGTPTPQPTQVPA